MSHWCFCNWSKQLWCNRVLWQLIRNMAALLNISATSCSLLMCSVAGTWSSVSLFLGAYLNLWWPTVYTETSCVQQVRLLLSDTKLAMAPLHMGLFILLLKHFWKTRRGQTTFSGIRRSGREQLSSANIQTVAPPFTCVFNPCSVSLIFIFSETCF